MKITPEFLVSFETEVKGLVTGNWQRVAQNLIWDRFMKKRPGATKREYLTWLLENAQIYPEGNGGNTRFDDMVAASMSLDHDNFGAGLRLTKNEINDNQMKDNPTVGALDYASKWARDIGSVCAYFPQKKLFELITAGTTALAYDGLPYFSAAHTINPNGGGATYSNIITGVPINAAPITPETGEIGAFVVAQKNFAKALAAVSGQRFMNGVPRYLKPTVLLTPTALKYRGLQLTGGDILVQSDNALKKYNIEPITAPELDAEPDVYYIGVEDTLNDELPAFSFSELEPFDLRTYGMLTEAALNRMDQFEWTMKGRNTAFYGHPYLFYRCTT